LEIQELSTQWNAFGHADPLWAVRPGPGGSGDRSDLDEFLTTGREDVLGVFDRLATLDVAVHPGRALDFGCGVGRLTHVLAEKFESCDGIDIASSMIERARELNRYGERCRFQVNERADLRLFADQTFDFVLSLNVLQHLESRYVLGYVREFMRILRPGGIAFFNVPSAHLTGPELPNPSAVGMPIAVALQDGELESREFAVQARMETYVLPETEVVAALEREGGVVFDVHLQARGGDTLASLDYVVAKSMSSHRRSLATEAGRTSESGVQAFADHVGAALDTARSDQIADRLAEIARLESAAREASYRLRSALQTLGGGGDLVGFGLTSGRATVGRLSIFFRRALRRLMFEVLHRQTQFNRTVAGLFETLTAELAVLEHLPQANRAMLARAEARIETLERAQSEARELSAELRRELERSELRVAMLGRRLRGSRSTNGAVAPFGEVELDYLDLTNRFRGSKEEIRRRQQGYVRYFAEKADVLDIGCGRGEFLGLLRDNGISAIGIDRDESMVAECARQGLTAVLDDGLAYVERRPAESYDGIFAAQVIEHLRTDDVVSLVQLAFSRLRRGGVLVLETINPACLFALTTFFVDPTHNKPIHPETLRWLAESAGFVAEIEFATPVEEALRLRPLATSAISPADVEEFNRGIASADHLLFGHQEYALVAHKPR